MAGVARGWKARGSVAGDAQSSMGRILEAVLVPVSRLLIKNNVLLPAGVETLKRSLVTAATSGAATATDSRVSLTTGVHRKDVKRLRAEIAEGGGGTSPVKGLALVLSAWANDPRFQEASGAPRALLRSGDAKRPGFDDLIRASKVDLAPATVLQELEAQSLVRRLEDGGIALLSTTFVAQSGEAALQAFEATVADHIRVAAENVLAPKGAPRHFDQVVRYSHLSQASVEALEAEARRLARAYLEQMNSMAHRLQSEDDAAGRLADGRFVSGVFIAPTPADAPEGGEAPQEPKEGDAT